MEILQKTGRTRAIGISDYNSTHIAETLQVATRPIALHQVEWNPLQHDEDMLALCKKHGIRLQAWSPLGGAKGSAEETHVRALKTLRGALALRVATPPSPPFSYPSQAKIRRLLQYHNLSRHGASAPLKTNLGDRRTLRVKRLTITCGQRYPGGSPVICPGDVRAGPNLLVCSRCPNYTPYGISRW